MFDHFPGIPTVDENLAQLLNCNELAFSYYVLSNRSKIEIEIKQLETTEFVSTHSCTSSRILGRIVLLQCAVWHSVS